MTLQGEVHERIQRHDTDTHRPQLPRDLRDLLLPHRKRLRIAWRVPVDRIPVGRGGRGPWTQRIQERFFGLFDGSVEDTRGWLTPVEEA